MDIEELENYFVLSKSKKYLIGYFIGCRFGNKWTDCKIAGLLMIVKFLAALSRYIFFFHFFIASNLYRRMKIIAFPIALNLFKVLFFF